jgi:archaellum component FlaF (FlaF/FlaG flagellin family)
MGFSTTAAVAIVGLSIFISLEIFTGSVIPTIDDYDASYQNMVNRKVDLLQTSINITTITVTAYGLNYNHSITIHNIGSITLDTSKCMVLINGINQQFTSSETYLYPEKTAYFNITNLPGDGDKTAKIITDNGIEDYYTYTI